MKGFIVPSGCYSTVNFAKALNNFDAENVSISGLGTELWIRRYTKSDVSEERVYVLRVGV
jgi:hypothetical protein